MNLCVGKETGILVDGMKARKKDGLYARGKIDFARALSIMALRKEPKMSAILVAEPTTPATIESLLQRLRGRGIKIPRPDEVRDYLTHYPDVIGLTEKVCEMTRAEFDGSAELSLELYVDPEIDDPHLTLYVQQEVHDKSTWDGIERIREGYEDEIAGLLGWLHVTADFRAPESR
jgi:hypothetical protein